MLHIKSLCVFCGSRTGSRDCYVEEARTLGIALAQEGITLVYGGARVGTMGELAEAAVAKGGRVIGVMPGHLIDREVAHEGLTEFHRVDTMLERKQRMADLSDAFVSLPGGLGTLDELFEMVTWQMLNLHNKPSFLLNIGSYWNPLVAFMQHVTEEGFLDQEAADLLQMVPNVESLMDRLRKVETSPKEVLQES